MQKIHNREFCSHCNEKAYLLIRKSEDFRGDIYIHHTSCPICGRAIFRISLS